MFRKGAYFMNDCAPLTPGLCQPVSTWVRLVCDAGSGVFRKDNPPDILFSDPALLLGSLRETVLPYPLAIAWGILPENAPRAFSLRQNWWALTGSNRRPSRCKRDALPTELSARTMMCEVPPAKTGRRAQVSCLSERCLRNVAAPARSPTRPPTQCILWEAGWGSGLVRRLSAAKV